ncbi:MAG TPA: hypothetical protein VK425_08580, partial [Acidimicrobiales bacterium]|nr:hypothetical protein [Acidimicrobiales bacterium]
VWLRTRQIRRKVARECESLNHPLTMRLKSMNAREPGRQTGERLRCRCGRYFKDVALDEL